jgi:FixJ family two-component response regulator
MNSELQKLLEDCLQNSTEKDYEVLKLVLRGIRNKQINNKWFWIHWRGSRYGSQN